MTFLSHPLGGAEGEQEPVKVDLQLTNTVNLNLIFIYKTLKSLTVTFFKLLFCLTNSPAFCNYWTADIKEVLQLIRTSLQPKVFATFLLNKEQENFAIFA